MLARGDQIHDYEIWGRLNEGGMSEVWLAKHPVLSLPVIIKTLRKHIAEAAGPTASQRMFNEARLMARVTSPRVVRALDAGWHESTPFLVQEYVDGIDMAELDRSRRRALGVGLPLWIVCHVMAETCQALHAAHQVGVIHRDVKPSNLFAAPETGIRLGDFGIAVARADTPPEEISGTIRFMAPEQLQRAVLGRATDVYGAGATAYDLRYGRAPFCRLEQILDADARAHFPPPKSHAEAYFQHLLQSMLEKDRERRPPDLAQPMKHFALLARSLRPKRGMFAVESRTRFRYSECDIVLRAGDLADEEADGLVSSANFEMTMRTGVGDALRRRAGDELEALASKDGHQPLGTCIATDACRLHARKVLHAVSAWNEASCVGRAMFRALLMADQLGLRSLAFAALGTGSARVSMETCANAMMNALRFHLSLGGTRLQRVTIVLGDAGKLRVFRDVAEEALRDDDEALAVIDLGLPDDDKELKVDGTTQLDPSVR
jgi:O-acetyl-ADP-ribose deacetylase (regulator of RNase III)